MTKSRDSEFPKKSMNYHNSLDTGGFHLITMEKE